MMYVCLWSPDWGIAAEPDDRVAGSGEGLEGWADVAPLLAGLAPRLRVEREVLWADGRGMDAGRLGERLVVQLAELGVAARAGVAAVPVVAELAARHGSREDGGAEGPTPFLVKERTGWGWRRTPHPSTPDVGDPRGPSSPDVGDVGGTPAPTPTSPGGRQGEGKSLGRGGGSGAVAPSAGERGRVVVVPVGEERSWLAELPVTVLGPTDRLRPLLQGVGVDTVGALASLERESVEVRLGAAAVKLWRLARADDRRLLFDRIPPERPHGSLEFVDYVLTDPSRLLFTANALLGPLCDRMVGRGEHARALRLTLPLANGETWERTIRPARPTASRETWLRLIRGLLDRLTVPDAVAGMRLEVIATEEAAVRQGDLFDRGFATAAAVEAAVARLAERQAHPLVPASTAHPLVERRGGWRYAPEAEAPTSSTSLGSPTSRGPGAAGRAQIQPPVSPSGGAGRGAGGPDEVGRQDGSPGGGVPEEQAGLSLQLLPEPRRVLVETARRRDHEAPVRLRDRHGWREVAVAAGPDRISGGQWEASSYAREYYRCVTGEGIMLWVYRDALDGGWYLHGWWD